MNFMNLIFIWLLPLTASNALTSGQNHSFTIVTSGEPNQATTQEAIGLNLLSEIVDVTPPITTGVNPTEGKTRSSLQTTQTTAPKRVNIQRAATPTNSTLSQINGSTSMKSTTEVQSKVMKSTAMVGTAQATNPTTPTRAPPMLSNSTQSHNTTSTSGFIRDKTTLTSTRPLQSTKTISTATATTKPDKDKSESTRPVTGDGGGMSTGLYQTSAATKTTKRPTSPENKAKPNEGTNHSKVVAGLIGGALVLMMVGFVVIYIKKRKLQKQQITTTDWAGPSPFLEGGADNGQVTLRSSNRISLSSFLPQRLSKRLSLLPETDEELQDMTPGTTFGSKHQESSFGQEVDGKEAKESNGSAAVVPEMKITGDTGEAVENSVSATSSQSNNAVSTNNNSEVAKDQSENPSSQSGAEENAPVQMSNGLEKP